MKKILALDLGDTHVGTAMSDELKLLAAPYKTVNREQLESFLTELGKNEAIETVIVGYPKTLRGTHSKQTEKILVEKEMLEQKFPQWNWVLWDERLTSKSAAQLQRELGKKDKDKSHSIAAAILLNSYLESLGY